MFEYINEVIQEVSMATCDAILNYIDKCETYNEFDTSKDFDEYVQESMMYFMEAASKDKDEITKWMDKKGYWYNGDNPKKKKECNRMYQFLKQHDFRPSDQTYKTDIDDGKGGKRRLKLTFETDKNETGLEGTVFSNKNRLRPTGIKTPEQRMWEEMIKRGENASYSASIDSHTGKATNEEILIPSKTLKQKQYRSGITIKHEEGHAANRYHNNRELSDADRPDLRKAIDDYKATGKKVNSHDDSVEEMSADEYAAKHTKIRNKNAGKKGASNTRKIKAYEIEKHFTKTGEFLTDNAKRKITSAKSIIKQLKYFENLKSIANKKDTRSLLIMFNIDNGGVGETGSDIKNIAKDYLPSLLNGENIPKLANEYIKQCEDDIKYYEDSLKSKFDRYKQEKSEIMYNHKYDELEKKSRQTKITEDMTDTIRHYKKMIKRSKEHIKEEQEALNEFNRLMNDKEIKKRLSVIENIYNKEKDLSKDDLTEVNRLFNEIKATGYIKEWIKKLEEEIKDKQKFINDFKFLKPTATKADSSDQMRIELAKRAIKEYFEDFIDDLIYND